MLFPRRVEAEPQLLPDFHLQHSPWCTRDPKLSSRLTMAVTWGWERSSQFQNQNVSRTECANTQQRPPVQFHRLNNYRRLWCVPTDTWGSMDSIWKSVLCGSSLAFSPPRNQKAFHDEEGHRVQLETPDPWRVGPREAGMRLCGPLPTASQRGSQLKQVFRTPEVLRTGQAV